MRNRRLSTRALSLVVCLAASWAAACGGSDGEPSGTGGAPGTGGTSTGGANTGGASTGGASTGGVATGGRATGGIATGGTGATGGMASTGGVQGTGGAGGGQGGKGTGGSAPGGANGGSSGSTGGSTGAFDPCPATGDCKVLPLGDSITFGTPTNNGGYRVELFTKAHMNSKHMTFVGSQPNGPNMVDGATFPRGSEGYPGYTIAQIDNMANLTKSLKDMPHIVLMHIGTNDMYGSDPNGAPMRLKSLIAKITAALPNSLLAVSTIVPLTFQSNKYMSTVTTYNATIPGAVQDAAGMGKHVIFVEMNKGFPSNGLGSDGVHPNDNVGYPWMGDTWYEAIKSYLH